LKGIYIAIVTQRCDVKNSAMKNQILVEKNCRLRQIQDVRRSA